LQDNHRLIRLGRDPGNDVVMDHVTISRSHLELFIDKDQNVFLSDMTSMYGTFVNNERITLPILLQKGDTVYLGDKQYFDWEYEVFKGEKRDFKKSNKKRFIKDNMDLIIIFGLILFVLLVLSLII
jgi:pSer/pThr/pTyr-binding forkhead associated (FHA) protein